MPAAERAEEEAEVVIVYDDRFARWDGTRWHIQVQIGLALPFTLYARRNFESRVVAMDIETVLACEKTFRMGPKGQEVDCTIDDVAFRAVPFLPKHKHLETVLLDMVDNLKGARVELQVLDDGRVSNIGLEGLSPRNRRENIVREQARQMFARVIAGFHLRLPDRATLRQGAWREYDASVFSLPSLTAPRGTSTLTHQLNRYKGHLVVQSIGEGLTTLGDDGEENSFAMKLNGVSLFDEDTGIMFERVWAVRGQATASSVIADGFAGGRYFYVGRIRMLGEEETPGVGVTQVVAPPHTRSDLPKWEPME
jgi:hypothetical protein